MNHLNPAEATRNRFLRRADWRFWLSNVQPRKSLCLAKGLLYDAVMAISESVITSPTETDCDLAVAVNPNARTLLDLHHALEAGGSCYTEWYLPINEGVSGVRKRLEAAGFIDVECYWPWPYPNTGMPLFWLPITSPHVIKYFLAHQTHSRSWLMQIARGVWKWLVRTPLMIPVCAVGRKPHASSRDFHRDVITRAQASGTSSTTPSRELTGVVLSAIQAQWPERGFNSNQRHLSWLWLTGGLRSTNKIVAIVFAEKETEPRLIVKLPRVPEAEPSLAQEAAILRAVHTLHPTGIHGVPHVIFFEKCSGTWALGETVLTGVPLFTQLRKGNFHELALQATDWLIQLAGRQTRQPRAIWWEHIVVSTLHDFEQYFGPVIDPLLLQQTQSVLKTLGDLPSVCEQRDFSPWNVLLDEQKQLIVLDWESAELQGLPALDLLYFLCYLSFFLDGAMESKRFVESYRTLLDTTTFTGRIVEECLTRYAEGVGLELTALRSLQLLLWLIHSRSEYKQFANDVGGTPTRDVLRGSVFVKLWEETVKDVNMRVNMSRM